MTRSFASSRRRQGRACRRSQQSVKGIKHRLDKHPYAHRYLVECCFSKLKQFRRVATRFEKTARNYRAVVTLAAIISWMR
jgi:transposase